MTRMHPQDLRAIMASTLQAGYVARHQDGESSRGSAIREADAILAELERTAKPECTMEDLIHVNEIKVRSEIRAHAYRCGFEDGLSGKVTKPVPETDKDAALESYREWEARILEAVKAAGWTIFDGPIQDWIRSDHLRAKAEGAREERERIIALFVENTKNDTFEDGEVFLTRWSALNGRETVHNEAGIRAALEPKP